MLDDINRTIAALLRAELPADIANQVAISFATPDDTFPPNGLALPAINLFLFDIHENTQLRDFEPTLERRADGSVQRTPPPVRVDCHYLVTAMAQSQLDSELDEHHILGATMRVLLRHRVLPASVLQGSLIGLAPPVRTLAIQHGAHPSGVELWQAIRGKARATLHYTLTIPVDVNLPESTAAPVTQLRVGGV